MIILSHSLVPGDPFIKDELWCMGAKLRSELFGVAEYRRHALLE
jgi:hypothetical protein